MQRLCVSDVMSTDFATATVTTPFRELVELIESHPGALPVLETDGRLAGVVSEDDLLPKQGYPARRDRRRSILPRRRRLMTKARGRTARDLMSSPAITVRGSASLSAAARMMVRHRVKQLPVLGPGEALVGMVSRADLLTAFLRSDSDIRAEVLQQVFGPGVLAAPGSVTVRVHEGVVHLKGRLPHRSVVEAVDELISDIDGVVAVVNRLEYRTDDTVRFTSRVSEAVPPLPGRPD